MKSKERRFVCEVPKQPLDHSGVQKTAVLPRTDHLTVQSVALSGYFGESQDTFWFWCVVCGCFEAKSDGLGTFNYVHLDQGRLTNYEATSTT